MNRYHVERGVNVPARVAAVLLTAGGLGDFQRRVRGQDPQVDEVLAAMLDEALTWRRAARSRHRDDTEPAVPASSRRQGMSTTEAARAIGCSTRTVQRDVDNGRLPATLVGGRWVLDPEDVEHARARRSTPCR